MQYFIILLVSCIILTAFSRHYTKIMMSTVLFIEESVLLYIVFTTMSIWMKILFVIVSLILIPLSIFISNKMSYDFTTWVLSFKLLLFKFLPVSFFTTSKSNGNKGFGDERIIGNVMPYNKYQLKYNGRLIISSETAAAGGMLISGSSGSGKTFGILSMIRQAISAGRSVIFNEFKGDPEVIRNIQAYALLAGYDVYVLCDGKANFNYDPLKNLNISGRIEAVMNMRKWSLDGSDAHYKTSTQLLLQKTIGEFSKIFDQYINKLEMEGKSTDKVSYTYEYFRWLGKYNAAYEEKDAYTTVTKLLEILITSSLSPMFKYQNEKTLDLGKIKNDRFIIITSFISSNKDLATSFSSLFFRDLLDEYTRTAPLHNTFLYVDEFGTLENPFIIKDILEKGRSAKIATTLSMQDINQIVIQTNEAYLNSILGTINSFIVYSGATRNTAEKFAGVQLADIEAVLMNLRKPIDGKKPTALYISKYPAINKRITSEVYRFQPYIYDLKGYKKAKEMESQLINNAGVNDFASEERDERIKEYEKIMAGELTSDEEKIVKSQTLEQVQIQQDLPQQEVRKQNFVNVNANGNVCDNNPTTAPKKTTLKLKLSGSEDSTGNDDLDSLIFGTGKK